MRGPRSIGVGMLRCCSAFSSLAPCQLQLSGDMEVSTNALVPRPTRDQFGLEDRRD